MTQPLAAMADTQASIATLACRALQRSQQYTVPQTGFEPRRLLTDPIMVPFPLPQGTLFLVVYPPEPAWLYPMLNTLLQCSRLPENWDTYGGTTPTAKAISTSLAVLSRLLTDGSVPPATVPTSEGGIQFEWYRAPGDELEIRVAPSGEISVFRVNEKARQMTERENISLDNLQPLIASLVARL